MRLSRLYISGFRSIRELDLRFTQGKNVIIGRNNAGKSNIVRALDIVLGESAPAFAKSENLTPADFHCSISIDEAGKPHEIRYDTIHIWCELERAEDEVLNWSEIDRCFGYSFWGRRNREAPGDPHRINLEKLRESIPKIFELNEDEAEKVWVDGKLKNQTTFRQQLDPMLHYAYAFEAKVSDKGIEKQLRFLYREGQGEEWILAFRASVRNELLQSAILPAFRDPTTQLRLTPWTWFGKMMRHLTKDCKDDSELQAALNQVQLAGDKIFDGVTTELQTNALSVSFPDARLSFQFHSSGNSDIYKNCAIYIDDGHKSPLVDKGAGIQSATIMGLFSYYVRTISTQASALLCVEEPELYLHPHARRVVSDRLDQFLDAGRNQVVVTTHGVEFLRTTSETFNLILVKKTAASGTVAQELDAKEFVRLLIDNNQNELFFADKVVLCEGHDEYLIRAAASQLFPGELDRQNVSIVAVQGKDQLPVMAKLVLAVGIKCFIVADFDFLLRDPSPVKGIQAEWHKSAEQLPPEFFDQEHVRVKQGVIAKFRNKLRTENPTAFYEAKDWTAFPEQPKLQENLGKLRRAGIGILDGEIENLSKDPAWIAPSKRKFDLDKAYELREKLADGASIEDLFECSSLRETLQAVLDA